ncbi:MAG TPA: murein L,D-transpeptidase catalytic domain family protein [Bdellovibrionota bacterium]|jgi:hypothetical protein|nr:murein L,D-transpeptidase catalytic domain family protein [Bdellovibrionota bacterium]
MTFRRTTTFQREVLRVLALFILLPNVVLAIQSHPGAKRGEALIKRQPEEVVDTYLKQIVCTSKTFKLGNENRNLSLAAQMNENQINAAFASEIFYSLQPGDEAKGSAYLKDAYRKSQKVLDNLRVLAVFFGHDIHNFYTQENAARTKRGEVALTKAEFFDRFDSGEISLNVKDGAQDVNLKAFIDARMAEIESVTAEMKYGCEGNRNFLHRQGSMLAQGVNDSAFMIPTTPAAVQLASNIAPKKPVEATRQLASVSHDEKAKPAEEATRTASRESRSRRFAHFEKFIRQGVSRSALSEAMDRYYEFRDKGKVTNDERMVVVDYTENSSEPRFWVLNLLTGNATGMKMGHGDGGGLYRQERERTAFLSNVNGSEASTYGAMLLGGPKPQNQSERPDPTLVYGLEPHNANAYSRRILVHTGRNQSGVTYVTDAPNEPAGRSDGCFALSEANAKWVRGKDKATGAPNLPAGTFLYAYKGNIPVVSTSAQARAAVTRSR